MSGTDLPDPRSDVEFVVADVPPRPANVGAIIAANLGKWASDADEAYALELGPNNCAASRNALGGK